MLFTSRHHGHYYGISTGPMRVIHWTNPVAIFIIIGSGRKIYDDDVWTSKAFDELDATHSSQVMRRRPSRP